MAQPTKKEQKIIDAAMKRLDRAIKSEDHNRKAAIDDLKFANGEQWDLGEKKRRSDKGRPALQFNLLPKFINQVTGDMLHNSPSIKVRPVDSKADTNIAKIRQGIINNIEYLSNSKAVYGYASTQMVTCGYGAWRVLTRYTEENPFLQEAYLESIRNPFLVYMDPDSKDQNYADAKYGFILEKMSKDQFKERYPKALYPAGTDAVKTGSGLGSEHWYDGELITVAEYFCVESETVEMLQLEDGRVVTKEEFAELKTEWEEKQGDILKSINEMQFTAGQSSAPPPAAAGAPPSAPSGMPPQAGMNAPPVQPQAGLGPSPQGVAPQMPPQQPPAIPPVAPRIDRLGDEPKVVKRRETEKTVIKQRILTSAEILEGGSEGNVFPGKFIPIVLLKGKELNIEGKNYVYSLIRHAKDPQKMLNYWHTAAAETISLAPKTPWLGTAKQFEGYENDYAAANVENFPFLKYNVDAEAPGPPQRVPVGQPPVAIFQQIATGENTLKSVIGMFNADVGAPGSEQTGAAVIARQRPGDIGTYEFSENLARAVLYTGRILNSIIPEIYDSERDVRLRNIDDTESFVPINTTVGGAMKSIKNAPEMYQGMNVDKLSKALFEEGKEAKFNDVTVGKYDVVVTVGPSYATQRQESATQLLQLVQAMPQQMGLAADLIVQNLDFKESDELANRIRKTLPPNIVPPKPGEPPRPPQPPSPAVIAAQSKAQSEQAKVQMSQFKLEQEKLKLQHEQLKLQAEIEKLKIELGMNSNNQATAHTINRLDKENRLQLDRDRLDFERDKFAHQQEKDFAEHKHKRLIDNGRLALDANEQFMEPGNNES